MKTRAFFHDNERNDLVPIAIGISGDAKTRERGTATFSFVVSFTGGFYVLSSFTLRALGTRGRLLAEHLLYKQNSTGCL